MTPRERIQDILKLPYINTGAIATEIYPDKPKQSARALFRNKLFEINGNRFNPDEEKKIEIIFKKICIVL